MRKYLIYILCLIGTAVVAQVTTPYRRQVECGSWWELSCSPFEDYHFVKWSDGDTNAVRQIQINENIQYIAYIAPNCEEFADLPVLALYDWLLMLDVRAIHDMGYIFNENNVIWYRVVGEPDKLTDNYYQDDEQIGKGYYLTIDQNFQNTGDYYAVVDVNGSKGTLCTGLMRTVIIHYAGATHKQRLALLPTNVYPGQQVRIVGLNPQKESTIIVYDMVGKVLSTTTTKDVSTFYLNAWNTAGCYNVVVRSEEGTTTLRYLVHNQ